MDRLVQTVKNALVTATPTNAANPTLIITSDQLGEYLFKPIANGDYSISVAAIGYNNFQTDIDIIMGEINDLDVELEK